MYIPPALDTLEQDRRLKLARSVLAEIDKIPRAVPVKPARTEISEERGVHHRLGVDGSLTFDIVDSDGVVQFEVKPAGIHCNHRTFRWCESVLDAIDPPRSRLKVI